MSWNNVIGQDRVIDQLKRTVLSGRMGHAYLFYGPDGVGKRAAAFALARLLQCQAPVDGDACGSCGPCNKALKGLHPDTHVLIPTFKDAKHTDISARLQALAADPYATVDFQRRPDLNDASGTSNKQVFYSSEMVNELLRRPMSLNRVEGKYRIAIVIDADKLRKEAANSFLKLLEEPGVNTVFVLITERMDHLLPTILSRCQKVRFDPLSVAEIVEALEKRDLASSTSAEVLARMADGSLSKALEFAASDDLHLVREQVLDFMRASFKSHRTDVIIEMVDDMTRPGREHTKFLLIVLLGLLRDLILLNDAVSPELVVNVDLLETLSAFSNNLPNARIGDMIEAVEKTSYLMERNTNTRLALITLATVLGAAMSGKRTDRVRTSLV